MRSPPSTPLLLLFGLLVVTLVFVCWPRPTLQALEKQAHRRVQERVEAAQPVQTTVPRMEEEHDRLMRQYTNEEYEALDPAVQRAHNMKVVEIWRAIEAALVQSCTESCDPEASGGASCLVDCYLAIEAANPPNSVTARYAGLNAVELAYRIGDAALARDLELHRGFRHPTQPTLERTVAQGWGRILATYAPTLQHQVIEAAEIVSPDSPLHEPLAWLGGRPACIIRGGTIVCLP